MSATQETRFCCDRCGHTLNQPVDGGYAGVRRPPEKWTVMSLGIEATAAQTHLCPGCADDFMRFMQRIRP